MPSDLCVVAFLDCMFFCPAGMEQKVSPSSYLKFPNFGFMFVDLRWWILGSMPYFSLCVFLFFGYHLPFRFSLSDLFTLVY